MAKNSFEAEEREILRQERISAYGELLDRLFELNFQRGSTIFFVKESEIKRVARELGTEFNERPSAISTSFKSVSDFGDRISLDTPSGKRWKITVSGNRLKFELTDEADKALMYGPIISEIFERYHTEGAIEVPFSRSDIAKAAQHLQTELRKTRSEDEVKDMLPKNLGDVVYTFRYRRNLPEPIVRKTRPGLTWIIMGAGAGKYKFVEGDWPTIARDSKKPRIKVLDDTPEIIRRYSLRDEQACLARIRYNRLIDLFLGVKASSLQNHLRTFVQGIGQVEIDELYVGVNRNGVHYIIPVQAKVGRDEHSVVQSLQDWEFCEQKYKQLTRVCVSAQYFRERYSVRQVIDGEVVSRDAFREIIVLYKIDVNGRRIEVPLERHYELCDAKSLSDEELSFYRTRQDTTPDEDN